MQIGFGRWCRVCFSISCGLSPAGHFVENGKWGRKWQGGWRIEMWNSRGRGGGLMPGFVFFMTANDEKCLRGACRSAC